ncbi:MAG: tetratricopeptide repeat protein [Desulfatitalea sp.]|nr:tetratricopeptide repeat protein [Desulfatitalea sp.]NNK02191.1 tetratricopeptide repeat protein [Desulfatitalea sp.]
MRRRHTFIDVSLLLLAGALALTAAACTSGGNRMTIATLREQQVEIKEVKIQGGLDKAMQSYQCFLEETPDSALTPAAIRRLADLKIEKEYGTLTQLYSAAQSVDSAPVAKPLVELPDTPAALLRTPRPAAPVLAFEPLAPFFTAFAASHESDAAIAQWAFQNQPAPMADRSLSGSGETSDDLERPGALEAIALYQRLLDGYPTYGRNDQVLYQMSRAYEELGRIEEAMAVMERLVRGFPTSCYIDEVQFRRAEYFFSHKRYLDAEEAYTTIVHMGADSFYYPLALYKLGWTYYKQEIYEEALHRYIALLDYKVSVGYNFSQTEDDQEQKRIEDTFRVISLSYSNLGGADSVVDYFSRFGKRPYEDLVYSHLAEFYFEKRRYADASATYNAFVSRNPFHKVAPNFHMRIIQIHTAGGFPSLVLEAKKAFASTYGLKAPYWNSFDSAARTDVLGHLKTNLTDLATHYHAGYQNSRTSEDKAANFKEALHWYREFLASFPADETSPTANHHLADLLLANKDFGRAAAEYEQTAYGYQPHAKASAAGYAAVVARRQHLAVVNPEAKDSVKHEVVRSSLKFAEAFPRHEKAAVVLGAAADDLYVMRQYERALAAATHLVENFAGSDQQVRCSAWLVIGHASYELERFVASETAYVKVLDMLPANDKSRSGILDNLAAAIYKQGEQTNAAEDYRAAADHFLRVGRMASGSKIQASAEFDAAGALIQLKAWDEAAVVLAGFRKLFPGHPLQPEVTQKIAYVYKEDGKLGLAAVEYERIESESQDDQIRQEALQVAAELYIQVGDQEHALDVYQHFVTYFPEPVEMNLETRNKIAGIFKARGNRPAYLEALQRIVAIDAAAGDARTPRTRYLAATAGLVLAEAQYAQFADVALVKPFKANLARKRNYMKAAIEAFNRLTEYEIGETTAAATFYLADIYGHFSKALITSERPDGLSPQELEQYELAIEEQAYPFEERGIKVHEKNLKLISLGVYNTWVDKSLQALARLMPARYDKPEAPAEIITSLDTYTYAISRPRPVVETIVAQQVAPAGQGDERQGEAAAAQAPLSEPAATASAPAQVQASESTPSVNAVEIRPADDAGRQRTEARPAPAPEPSNTVREAVR